MRGFTPGLLLVCIAVFVVGPALRAMNQPQRDPCEHAQPVPAALRVPAQLPPGEPVAVEHTLFDYLSSYRYRDLGWCVDKSVRDTGPFLHGVSYGTHSTVRIYYSPEIVAWLRNGRRGVPADGAVIIKEQYGSKPARYFAGTKPGPRPTDWTIMIRRTSASHDGWFWGEIYAGMFDSVAPTQYPNAGYGIYCLRCHASAEKALTFSSLDNISGYPGRPITYKVDSSWQVTAAPSSPPSQSPSARPATLAVQTFPPETLDTFLSRAHGAAEFVTSDQCMSCHSGVFKPPLGPTMWAHGANISEYGEWRWSPMALAGRDPVFYAQFEHELASIASRHDPRAAAIRRDVTNTCLNCHGMMGERAFAHDFPGHVFPVAALFDAMPRNADAAYGGLARDGVSCATCHHAVSKKPPAGADSLPFFLNHVISGQLGLGPPAAVYGPFHDDVIATHPMKEALGITPRYSSYIESPRMCGSCHTINLPLIDAKPHQTVVHNVEQATYLEWLNSKYQTEYHPMAGARSCQDCHMPEGGATKIALVEDQSYPETTYLASRGDVTVRTRKSGFRRHELLGLNAFLLSMFREFPGVMGVRTSDYMSTATDDLDHAIANIVRQARHATATVAVRTHLEGRRLIADVEVVNRTGHRFPTGVAFRRAFLDVEVRDLSRAPDAAPIFASGRSDGRGRILGTNGLPLPSESFADDDRHRQAYQEHFDEAHPITSGDQVQIFEELMQDASGRFTTSFLRRDREVKDNRILPIGWTRSGPEPDIPRYFLAATFPKGRAAADPRYFDGKGHAVVRYVVALPPGVNSSHLKVVARLYYQSFAPYFLDERTRGNGPAALRLAALVRNLDLQGTALAGWHLLIAEDAVTAR
ncbi:MAG TPA: hypothetical protein VIW73_00475 [Candidatus Cybelea sp.]